MKSKRFFPSLIFLLSIPLFGLLHESGSPSKENSSHPENDTNWLTYEVPDEYSFQYPKSWELPERWKQEIPANAWPKTYKNLGFEIVKLRKHDCNPCKNETCAMCPNSASVSVSIQPKDSMSLFEIAHKSTLYEEIWRYSLEKSNRDEYGIPKIIKLDMIVDGYPTISWFIDYKEGKYAHLYGAYSQGKDSTIMANNIQRIFESFKVLE